MRDERSSPWRRIALGLLVFAVGAALAFAFLPEWRVGRPAHDKDFFIQEYRELAAKAGLRLAPGEPRVRLVTRTSYLAYTWLVLGDEARDWLERSRTAVLVEVLHPVVDERGRPAYHWRAELSLDGVPRRVSRESHPIRTMRLQVRSPETEDFTRLLLGPGESPGATREGGRPGWRWRLQELEGSSPPQNLSRFSLVGQSSVSRQAGTLERVSPGAIRLLLTGDTRAVNRFALLCFPGLLFWLLLAWRRRVGPANGAMLALAATITCLPGAAPVWRPGSMGFIILGLSLALFLGLAVVALFSLGESLIRSRDLGFTTSLDTLRKGRLGPRGGRALLEGFGYGAAVAGLQLGLLALAVPLPGIRPESASLHLPLSPAEGMATFEGIFLAAGMLIAAGLSSYLPARWAPAAAVLLAPWLAPLSWMPVTPLPAGWIAGLAPAALLLHVFRRSGLTSLLTAAVVSTVLPVALFAALQPSWMPGALAASVAFAAGVVLLGALGLSRPREVDAEGGRPPAFVRRLRGKRSLRAEMDLLTQMQRGLLPRQIPEVEGYEIAVRSWVTARSGGDLYDVQRDDQGYLWIALSDVAGQGYSCTIAQAMVKGALVSSIAGDRLPGEVLRRVGRTLREGGAACQRATVALVKLEPWSGRAWIGNAGSPPPLVSVAGEVSRLGPGGPPLERETSFEQEDLCIQIPPGGLLLVPSPGIAEAMSWNGVPYGAQRLLEALRLSEGRPTEEVLEEIFGDWSEHLPGEEASEDATLLVLRRKEAVSLAEAG
ncbi:MAG TPA: SpoIIE family protein phosphatase [Thermoanaerobaculia bacterium]|nr:SpoIIE family protein phosphatase [Thermoanaerobaculia bacterium]